MGNVITNLKARFGVDTTDFKKGLKDGERSLSDFQEGASNQLDKFAGMFGVNMGAVNDSISTAQRSLGFLRQSFVAAAKGGDVMTVSMKLLKWAIVSTGFGAIVVALGTIIAYFMRSGEGADKFAKILMQVKSVVNNVIDRLAVFGKGLWEVMTGKFKQGWETMTGAFKGMGEEIKNDWKAAGDLADRLDKLDEKETSLIVSLEERRAKAAELRLQAKEELEDQKKKLSLIDQAASLYKSVFGDQLAVERERLAIMKEQIAIQSSDPTDEQKREIAEQEAKINSLLREQAEQLKALSRERKSVAEAVANELALESAKSNQIAIQKADLSNLSIPSLSSVIPGLVKTAEIVTTIKKKIVDVGTEMNKAVESAVETAVIGFGELLGQMAIGDAGIADMGKLLLGGFADLLIKLGGIAISAGIGIEAIRQSLLKMKGIGAIAAGITLVALGVAIKAGIKSLGSSMGNGSSASSGSGAQNFTYDTRSAMSNESNTTTNQVVFRIEGKDLVGVLENQNRNHKYITGKSVLSKF